MFDEDLRAFGDDKRHGRRRPVLGENHASVDGGRGVPAVEHHQQHAVAVESHLLLVVGLTGPRGDRGPQRRLVDGTVPRDGDWTHDGSWSFGHDQPDVDGHRRGVAGLGDRSCLDKNLRVAPAAVLLSQRGGI